MKRILVTWKSTNGVIMGAKVQDSVVEKLQDIENDLNAEKPDDPTAKLAEFIQKENLDFFNPVDVQTSNYKIQIIEE